MELTYSIDQLIALQSGSGYFDLHNNYELLSALPDGTRYYLHFKKRAASWVKAQDPSHLALVFEQVNYVQVSDSLQMPTSIEEIGFKEPNDFDIDWFMVEPGAESVHILFRLENDHFIRIGAAKSLLLTA